MTRRVDDRWFLPIEGLVSGVLACLIQTLPFGVIFLVGLAFGVVISAHVRLFRGMRSTFHLIGFTATCTIAYTIAVFATARSPFRPQFLNFSGTGSWAIDSSSFFTGGFLGAAIVCTGIFFFLAPLAPPRNLTKFLLKALGISVACGFLGVLGWSVGEHLRNAQWLAGFGAHLDYHALYIIWQTGAAPLFGLLLSPQQTLVEAPAAARPVYVPLQMKRERALPPVAASIFLVLVFATLGWFIARQVRGERSERRMLAAQQAVQQRLAAERPSSRNLPAIVELPVEQVLVLKPIAGHPCGRGFKWGVPGRSDFVPYTAEYKRSETAGDGEVPFAVVSVDLYPNSDWAIYATREDIWNSEAEDPRGVTIVTKFGNKVIMNTLTRHSSGGGDLCFYWASGNRFVQVTFHASEQDEFLKEYLARYPSTL